MKLHSRPNALMLVLGLALVSPGWAVTTYTYTSTNTPTYSGSFSVDVALVDGTHHLLQPAEWPAGFAENFFSTPFVDSRGVSRTPTLSLFDITVAGGEISKWDIRATSPFTFVTYSSCGRTSCRAYHDNATLIYHATNQPYLPGNGGAYQTTIPSGDYATYHAYQFAYQEALTGVYASQGVWSIAGAAAPVPENATCVMLLVGLGALGRRVRLDRGVC